jgi:hypothetical protein
MGEGMRSDGRIVNFDNIAVDTLGAATQALALKTPSKTLARGKRAKIEESI